MSDLDATTPRVFLARHGETEWTKNGRYTGKTELDLTPDGVRQVTSTAAQFVGHRKLIDPAHVARVWVSPRKRTRQTFRCLFDCSDVSIADNKVTFTEDITEWDYGDYEGLLVGEIRAGRVERGLDKERGWNIWRDGCEGGDSAQQVTGRLDRLIAEIRDIQRPYMNGEKPVDVVVVAHGLILRCFVKRWLGYPLDMPLTLMLSPGGIGILSYKNRDIDEPALFIGISIPPLED
ncbi:phosphoglycerate mutase [Lindgomyces ingoldianus]|uniref:Phosphoglycerate mutase n=1 Tax=Lindgomyces ingoldianus TaxID=673940 RepID=A0ACB6R1F2_9PLEO|nr:phosphoglycerate mutase [Lindgomyces ingoldianus]KAF2472658.1 phosphoglycerate mutase [Lindgomyces ingoldianus]